MRHRNAAIVILAAAGLAVTGLLGARTVLASQQSTQVSPATTLVPIAATSTPVQQSTVTSTPAQQGTVAADTPGPAQGTTGQCTPAPSGPGCIYPLPTQISMMPPPGSPASAAPDEAGGQLSPAAIVRAVTGMQAFNGTVITRAEVIGTPAVSGGTETAEVNETISGGAVVYRVTWAYNISGGTWTATPEYQVSPG
jgi:hypothetical protein